MPLFESLGLANLTWSAVAGTAAGGVVEGRADALLTRAAQRLRNHLSRLDSPRHYGEPRWITVVLIEITGAYTSRGGAIRLVSARKAGRHEREDYWNR